MLCVVKYGAYSTNPFCQYSVNVSKRQRVRCAFSVDNIWSIGKSKFFFSCSFFKRHSMYWTWIELSTTFEKEIQFFRCNSNLKGLYILTAFCVCMFKSALTFKSLSSCSHDKNFTQEDIEKNLKNVSLQHFFDWKRMIQKIQ